MKTQDDDGLGTALAIAGGLGFRSAPAGASVLPKLPATATVGFPPLRHINAAALDVSYVEWGLRTPLL